MNLRAIIVKILGFFGIKRNRPVVPKIPLALICPVLTVDPIEKEDVNGNITVQELTVISQIVNNKKPHSIFEIGTFNGRTTLNLAKFSSNDSVVYTLDLPKKDMDSAKFGIEDGDRKYVNKDIIGDRFRDNPKKIVQLYGDSATFDFSPYYGKMDFVFVDGSHSEPYAKNDTEIAIKMIKEGGVILWHDYGVWRGVTKVLNHYYRHDSRFKTIKHLEGSSFVYYKHINLYDKKNSKENN